MTQKPRRAGSSAPTSRSLIERIKKDDSEAWDRLVALYAPLVYRWCRRRGLLEQDIADVVQEVFQAVAVNIAKFRKAKPQDTFRGWLRIITRNKMNDRYRRGGREPEGVGGTEAHRVLTQFPARSAEIDDEPESDLPEDDAGGLGDPDLFHRALEMIRADFQPRTWQAFYRTAVDGQPPKEVADELDMSPGAVRVAKSRVLHRLRQELGDLMD